MPRTDENACVRSPIGARSCLNQPTEGPIMEYTSRAAQDAQAYGYGGPSYWASLDESAQRAHDYFAARGHTAMAARMLSRTLAEALRGNDGD